MSPTKEAARKLAHHFEMFARNGVWGTCGGCPRDGAGNVLPELCADKDRSDHLLPMSALAQQFYDEVMRIKRRNDERENCTCGAMQCSYCMSR